MTVPIAGDAAPLNTSVLLAGVGSKLVPVIIRY